MILEIVLRSTLKSQPTPCGDMRSTHPYCLAMSSCLRELLDRCSSTMFRLSSKVSFTFGRAGRSSEDVDADRVRDTADDETLEVGEPFRLRGGA
jgi:hypothetical protein